ncbi:MAG: acetyl-CoA carboxylase biotin carboxylase subunit [Ammonifex sp.]|nr:MAG: acetyl-CoA carboxylase biotin carboxylase subunit [Ammonifex sp.]
MFNKILIANRGEIALRIIRACRELGIKTVMVYSDADRDSLPVRLADEAFCIGPAAPAKSYLNFTNIISVAEVSGAEAIHPGYGFLAESAKFAEICASCGIVFIGPPVEALEKMGDKAVARKTVAAVDVPVVPGSEEVISGPADAKALADEMGYPVLIKASAGGGGRGMRVVHSPVEIERSLQAAQAESEAAFGSPDVYLEKYVEEPRHIEFQILGDKEGNIVYFGERDCSIQRRNQKLLEEAPSTALGPALRRRMGEAAIKAARAAGYYNAGTVEFLLDKHNNFYFIEMNTRIQVEHPVTEMVARRDLVKEQIRIAAGEPMQFKQADLRIEGWAIECRINAEDPSRNFAPCPGVITTFIPPGGPEVRVDTAAYPGYTIQQYYDSLIAKVVTWGRDREEAVTRMERALEEFIIEGVNTTIPFHQRVLRNAFFRRGEIYTNFVQRRILAEEN